MQYDLFPPLIAHFMQPPALKVALHALQSLERHVNYTNATILIVFFSYWNSPEGIETLCSHLEVPHTDVRILMLAWYMSSVL